VPDGRLPLANGTTVEPPRLDAAGVAAICTFELEQSTYESGRAVTTEPRPPTRPRIPVADLHQALDKAGYRVSSSRVSRARQYKPRRELADRTGINGRMIDRICSGAQKTLAIDTAIVILEEVGAYGEAAELNEKLNAWAAAMHLNHYDRYEHLDKLAVLATRILSPTTPLALTPAEITALHDRQLLSRAASSYPSDEGRVPTAEERLTKAERWFREAYGREPSPLSPRLQSYAQATFRAERRTLRQRERALHKGLNRPVITTTAVYDRTHRLRRAGRLPAKSKPRPFQPPAYYDDTFGCNDRDRLRTSSSQSST
jgi:hypothetical protein